MSDSKSQRLIEHLRNQMVELALAKNSFTDDEVVQLSQKLDRLLMKEQRRLMLPDPMDRLNVVHSAALLG